MSTPVAVLQNRLPYITEKLPFASHAFAWVSTSSTANKTVQYSLVPRTIWASVWYCVQNVPTFCRVPVFHGFHYRNATFGH